MSAVTVHHGDSRDVLKSIADSSIDACVCDPPYALVSIVKRFGSEGAAAAKSNGASGVYNRASAGFMGQQWDNGQTAFDPLFWVEVLRVLKPGAHIVAFSGTRTYHRLASAVEDAGFEIRDQLGWLFGSGFPKSHNQAGGWKGWGSALKPAWEPVCLARKPMIGTIAANLAAHGTGALNIDGCRVEGDKGWPASEKPFNAFSPKVGDGAKTQPAHEGRWPANVVHDGSAEVVEAFPQAPGQQAPVGPHNGPKASVNVYGDYGAREQFNPRGDAGSAARFFYSAKADELDRLGSKHPTVKPVDLMAWLCRLVTPPGGTILDPFAGTGTTGLAAMREGFDCILIEREAQYVADINRRLAWARGEGRLTALETGRVEPDKAIGADLPLFSGDAA